MNLEVRQLLPEVRDEALDSLYADLELPSGAGSRGHVYLDMVSSLDGAAAVGGRTADLGGEADALAFRRLRDTCDVILVGAGTVRAEDYGPPSRSAEHVERRRARGLAPVPRLAVVTASLMLDAGSRLFADPARQPILLVPGDADRDRLRELAEAAEVIEVGRRRVDLAAALAQLAERGLRRVLCEGGPTLSGELLGAGLVDELFLTVAPLLAGGHAPRIVADDARALACPATLVELREHAGELLLRYRIQARS